MRVISSLQDIKSYINNHKSDDTISFNETLVLPFIGKIRSFKIVNFFKIFKPGVKDFDILIEFSS